MNTSTFNTAVTVPNRRIVQVIQEAKGYVPEYDLFTLPVKVSLEAWRPSFPPEMFLADVPANLTIHNRKNQGYVHHEATKDSAAQLGRALFLEDYFTLEGTEGRWQVMAHKYTQRKIRVSMLNVGEHTVSQVEETTFDAKLDKWLAWTAHPMSAKRGLWVEEVGHNEWYVMGNTYPIRETIKALGGRWNPTKQAWKFTNGLPVEIAAMLSDRVTKYHMLADLLAGNKIALVATGKDNTMSKDEANYRVVDAFRREAWYTHGYDWKDFPQPINTPEAIKVESPEAGDTEEVVSTGELVEVQTAEGQPQVQVPQIA
jgi:hypothetical protein